MHQSSVRHLDNYVFDPGLVRSCAAEHMEGSVSYLGLVGRFPNHKLRLYLWFLPALL